MSQGLCPGKPPESELDRSEGDEGGQGFGEVLEILGKSPVRPNQEEVRPTTQRRGSTTKPFGSGSLTHYQPFTSSLRLTISMRSGGTFATTASTCRAL